MEKDVAEAYLLTLAGEQGLARRHPLSPMARAGLERIANAWHAKRRAECFIPVEPPPLSRSTLFTQATITPLNFSCKTRAHPPLHPP